MANRYAAPCRRERGRNINRFVLLMSAQGVALWALLVYQLYTLRYMQVSLSRAGVLVKESRTETTSALAPGVRLLGTGNQA